MFFALAIPSFIAGFLMFLAPCTLPLVPGYLAFISGVSFHDAGKMGATASYLRKRILWNAFFYVLGFSLIFILLGTFLSGLGQLGLGNYRFYLQKISGVFIMLLGLYMTRLFDFSIFRFLNTDRHFTFTRNFTPGKPVSSFLFGATFALGWSPCIGPIVGSILLLASSSATVAEGVMLLAIFSLGLAIPFLLVALAMSQAMTVIRHIGKYLGIISVGGGILIAILGFFILTGSIGVWTGFFYRLFSFIRYESLLNYY